MRIRHAMAAGTAVALLSAATTLMASATASAGVATQVAPAPAAAVAVAQVGTAAAGSAAGLAFGLLLVLGIAAISFVVRVGATRRTPARVITIPQARSTNRFAPAFAE